MSTTIHTPYSQAGVIASTETFQDISSRPIAWTIAGSDSSGGAGIQADLKTMNALGVHACSIITAITAQNTLGISRIEPITPSMVAEQFQTLYTDLPPVAIKLGMLASQKHIRSLANQLKQLQPAPRLICDPVLLSSSGNRLLDCNALEPLKQLLFPMIDLLTPNLTEAQHLLNNKQAIESDVDMEQAANALLQLGIKAVLLKGGHCQGRESQDFYTDGKTSGWLTSPRQLTRHQHGTGCTLSAAITATVAQGYEMADACVIAKAYVNQALRLAPGLGQGQGPLCHSGWPDAPLDLPWLTPTASEGRNRLQFPNCGDTPLGFYPIVNRADWLTTLLPMGVSSIQLRIKDLEGDALEQEIARACAIARAYQARLFINDYADLALKYGAYGVHLGQGDLAATHVPTLAAHGIRLGISTHCYAEVARAHAIRPSYIAIGPIYPTTTKAMRFPPQGIPGTRRWRTRLSYPLVGIGGINLNNAPELFACGLDGLAVVRDLANASNIPAHVANWLELASRFSPPRQLNI